MTPLFGPNEAMTKALETYKTTTYGPPDELNMDVGDTRGLFTTGRCALTMDWGDIGTLTPGTYAQDKTGATITPGLEAGPRSRHRQARAVRRDHLPERGRRRELRPVRVVRWLVRRRQRGRARRPQQDAAYAFLSYMSSPAHSGVDVTLGKTGYNPYRTSQFANLAALARRRPQRGRRDQLSRRHQDQPQETPTWCSTCASR